MDRRENAELMAEVQKLWLESMKEKLAAGEINSTDMATLARVLLAGGMMPNFDDLEVPEELKDKLKRDVPTFSDEVDDYLKGL